jgi:hypothetical protein
MRHHQCGARANACDTPRPGPQSLGGGANLRELTRDEAKTKMQFSLSVVLVACVISAIELAAGISIAPGDEEGGICQSLRSSGAAPTPGYAPNMRVLMDSLNYQNLLPPRVGAVWDQVDNDTSNSGSMTTNVSFHSIL